MENANASNIFLQLSQILHSLMLSDTFTSSNILSSVQKAQWALGERKLSRVTAAIPQGAALEPFAVGQRQPEGYKSTDSATSHLESPPRWHISLASVLCGKK